MKTVLVKHVLKMILLHRKSSKSRIIPLVRRVQFDNSSYHELLADYKRQCSLNYLFQTQFEHFHQLKV